MCTLLYYTTMLFRLCFYDWSEFHYLLSCTQSISLLFNSRKLKKLHQSRNELSLVYELPEMNQGKINHFYYPLMPMSTTRNTWFYYVYFNFLICSNLSRFLIFILRCAILSHRQYFDITVFVYIINGDYCNGNYFVSNFSFHFHLHQYFTIQQFTRESFLLMIMNHYIPINPFHPSNFILLPQRMTKAQ